MRKLILTITILIIYTSLIKAQDKNWTLDGYISGMQSAIFGEIEDPWLKEDQIHNRLNFSWYASDNFTFKVQMRNRLIWGDRGLIVPFYFKSFKYDNGWLDLTANIADGKSYVLTSTIDRIYTEYNKGNWNIILGRQRINWGKTLAWNANDIFNTYSFFDFDYAERPGSDAIRIQYYTSYTSSIELAAKLDSANNATLGALYKFNWKSYDIQILAGLYNEMDYVLGAGWEGAIGSVSFKGEGSYLIPKEKDSPLYKTLLFSTSLDYTFKNSLMVLLGGVYKQNNSEETTNSLFSMYGAPMSLRDLSFTEFAYMSQVSYPITPLLNGTMAIMLFPEIKGYYVSPGLDYSLRDDLYLSLIYQFFNGEFTPNIEESFNLGFIRLKWSF